jgi:hypothetical protein
MRYLMCCLRSPMPWLLLDFTLIRHSFINRVVVHINLLSIATLHLDWPLRVTWNFLNIPTICLQKLRSILTISRIDSFLIANSHSVVLWGLFCRCQTNFSLGQIWRLCSFINEDIVRKIALSTFLSRFNSLIHALVPDPLADTLGRDTMILLVKVFSRLSLILKTVCWVCIGDNSLNCLNFITSLRAKSQVLGDYWHLSPIVIKACTLQVSLFESAQIVLQGV